MPGLIFPFLSQPPADILLLAGGFLKGTSTKKFCLFRKNAAHLLYQLAGT